MAQRDPNRVLIFDTTLRDGEQSPGCSMTQPEKLRMAKALAELGVDVIEAGFPIASRGDWEAVHEIEREVRGPIIAGLARCNREDIDKAMEMILASRRTIVCWAMGLTQHKHSVPTIREVVNFLLLRGDIGPDGGDYSVPGKLNFVSVSQELPRTELTVLEYVRSGDSRLMEIEAAMEKARAADDGDTRPFMAACEKSCVDAGQPAEVCRQACACTADGLKRDDLWRQALPGQMSTTERARTAESAPP